MWNNSKSVILSAIVARLTLAVLTLAAIFMPHIIRWYTDGLIGDADIERPLFFFSYALLLCGFLADFKLISLLGNIRRGEVFVHQNTVNLRAISYYCFAVGLICFVFGFLRPIVFVLCFAACFMGLILRVVKNVVAAAVELREENDGTI